LWESHAYRQPFLKIIQDARLSVTHSITFGEQFQRVKMANKSLKSKTKTKYTDLHNIIDEICRDSDTDILQEESESDQSFDSLAEAMFLDGEDSILDR
jgi:hypothetical protein